MLLKDSGRDCRAAGSYRAESRNQRQADMATASIGSVANRLSIKSGETKDLGDVKGKVFQE